MYTVDVDIWQNKKPSASSQDTGTPKDILSGFYRIGKDRDGNNVGYRTPSQAVAVGDQATASGDNSCAVGPLSQSADDNATAIGAAAVAIVQDSTVVGQNAGSYGFGNTIIGRKSAARGYRNVIVGRDSGSRYNDCVIIGDSLNSTADGQILIGNRILVDILGQLFIDGINVSAELMDLPFSGIVGSGVYGPLHITTNTTDSSAVPMYQTTDFTVDPGVTFTAAANNPGGFFISCTGTCTIAGTIDVSGLGASGGTSITGSPSNGRDAYPGLNLGGSGGGGGGFTGGSLGGYGGPVRLDTVIGGWAPGGIARGASDTSWFGTNTGATNSQLRREGGTAVLAEGAGGNAASNGTAGNSTTTIWTNVDSLFNMLWLTRRELVFGYGAGGGGGGANGAASGAGGNGGGMCVILCDTLNFTGTINANGAAGTAGSGGGGGGGGGGGVVIIGYRHLTANSGTINVNGGAGGVGGTTGGAGGNGYSRVFDMRS